MNYQEWAEETRRRLFKVSKYFNAAEYQAIWNFIETAKEKSEV
jgi:hypothetical protein